MFDAINSSKLDKQPTLPFNLWRGINLAAAICMLLTSAASSLPGFRLSSTLFFVTVAEWFFLPSLYLYLPLMLSAAILFLADLIFFIYGER